MSNFSVGDKVIVRKALYAQNTKITNGMIGTICCFDNEGWAGVVFEKNISGHTCDGTCEYGHGWYIKEIWLEPVEMEMEANENDLALFMNSIPVV